MRKIDGLEGLRGYMAIWVWITHVTTMAALPLYKTTGWGRVLANGDLAVGVFIMLSGFVISASVLKDHSVKYTEYITRRALRLFPAYIVCLIASVVILQLSIDTLRAIPWAGTRTDGRMAYLTASQENFWPHLILHAGLLHGLIPDRILPYTSYAFMGQAWSLTLEWQFYLLAPALILGLERIRSNFAPMWLVLAGLLTLSTQFTQPSFLPSNLYFFFIGYLTHRLFYSQRRAANKREQLLALLTAAITIAAVVYLKGLKGGAVMIWFLAIYSLQGRAGVIGRATAFLIENRFARWLGTISYGFYCVHMVAIFLCAYILLVVFRVDSHILYAVSLIGASLVLSLLLSWLIYHWIEHPFIEWGKKLTRHRKERTSVPQQLS